MQRAGAKRKTRRRRGMSFIEVICSVVVGALTCVMMIAVTNASSQMLRSARVYTQMKVYTASKIEQIQVDLEAGHVIDAENYNDTGEGSGIRANVFVEDAGVVYGDSVYYVYVEITELEHGKTTSTEALLRKGCTSHAP